MIFTWSFYVKGRSGNWKRVSGEAFNQVQAERVIQKLTRRYLVDYDAEFYGPQLESRSLPLNYIPSSGWFHADS